MKLDTQAGSLGGRQTTCIFNMIKQKKLFIFDLDGVLVDACEWHKDALNEALEEMCNYSISHEEHIRTFNGIPTREKLNILSSRGIVSKDLHIEINKLKQNKTISIINKKAIHRPEKINLIKTIKEHNHSVCCYTNSIRKTATLMLKKTGIYNLFDVIITNEDVEKSKPSPEGYINLIKLFDIEKKRCYIIEDSPKGREAAYASGANVIEVSDASKVNLDLIKEFL